MGDSDDFSGLGARGLEHTPQGRSAPPPASSASDPRSTWRPEDLADPQAQQQGASMFMGTRALGEQPANPYRVPKFDKPVSSSSKTKLVALLCLVAVVVVPVAVVVGLRVADAFRTRQRADAAVAYVNGYYAKAGSGDTVEAGDLLCQPAMDDAYRIYKEASGQGLDGTSLYTTSETAVLDALAPAASSRAEKGKTMLDGYRLPDYEYYAFVDGQESGKNGSLPVGTMVAFRSDGSTCIAGRYQALELSAALAGSAGSGKELRKILSAAN